MNYFGVTIKKYSFVFFKLDKSLIFFKYVEALKIGFFQRS